MTSLLIMNLTKLFWASLVAQMVKHLPAMWETWVQSLHWKDPLEKEMATHSSTLAWKIPWTEEPDRLQLSDFTFTLTKLLKALILWHSAFFIVQLSHPYMTTGETIALTIQAFVSKVMSLLFNTLFRLVITFLPRSKRLLISWLQSLSVGILEPKKINSVSFHCFPHICHEVMGLDATILVF